MVGDGFWVQVVRVQGAISEFGFAAFSIVLHKFHPSLQSPLSPSLVHYLHIFKNGSSTLYSELALEAEVSSHQSKWTADYVAIADTFG